MKNLASCELKEAYAQYIAGTLDWREYEAIWFRQTYGVQDEKDEQQKIKG